MIWLMFHRLPFLGIFRITALGIFVALLVLLVMCVAMTPVGGAEHMDMSGCLRTITITTLAVPLRGCEAFAIPLLLFASMTGLAFVSQQKHISSLFIVMGLSEWQRKLRQAWLRLCDVLIVLFRQGVIHGKIYQAAFRF